MSVDEEEVQLGIEPCIHPSAEVRDTRFGHYCEVGARTKIAESSFGDYAYVMNDADLIYTAVGRFANLAAYSRINPGQHPMERASLHHFQYRSRQYGLGPDDPDFFEWRRSFPVSLGADTWIGHGAVVMGGVRDPHAALWERQQETARLEDALKKARADYAQRRISRRERVPSFRLPR